MELSNQPHKCEIIVPAACIDAALPGTVDAYNKRSIRPLSSALAWFNNDSAFRWGEATDQPTRENSKRYHYKLALRCSISIKPTTTIGTVAGPVVGRVKSVVTVP